ncbi:S41 family peptidase [Ferrimonas aestuarii]|uniref:Tricorn protease homolog n=1 Tax=Ferrimonas aestuarii TaxID=2569539 RepID=A0A4U1BXF9_9GAMM|nr:S41 family peptidase [Ferrimonas aestuarii]TKB58415.1 hypothetical protein FCL42_01320 [Ferrimonas aestuarii]
MKKLLTLVATLASVTGVHAASPTSHWFRNAAISPDGTTVLFTAKGDIYQVPISGGKAVPLVTDSSWDGYPIWSHDGQSIAFASDRNGSLDVYVMALNNPVPTRLTFHSSDDFPSDFSPDNRRVIFNSGRQPSPSSSAFPTTRMHQLYSVPVTGGTPTMELTAAAMEARVSPDGKTIAYMDNKSYEDGLRKHDRSSFARDIWLYDKASKEHKKLTGFAGGDSTPVWSADGNSLYYLSEQGDNNFNAWKMNADGSAPQQLSHFDTHPVRSLSLSDNGTLAFSWHGELYTQISGQSPKKLNVQLASMKNNLDETAVNVAGQASWFSVSPSGKEVAFVARGELFVSSVDYGTTVRLTNTPEQERGLSWFPDGRSIAFASERDGAWGLYKVSISDANEPYFFAATKFDETQILKSKVDNFQPVISPDGKKLAYLHQRDEIRVLDLENGTSNTVFPAKYNYSYSDGDISFVWSPDSQWIAASFVSRGLTMLTDIGIAPADGSKAPVDVSMSGYGEFAPQWASPELLLFASDRFGMRSHGSWGSEMDVMGLFLTQDAYDNYKMSKEERELQAEAEEKAVNTEEKDDEQQEQVAQVTIDWHHLDDRMVRLTKHSSDMADFVLTPEQHKLYYLARFEGGYDLWLQDFEEHSTSLALKLNAESAALSLNENGDEAILLADGVLSKLSLGEGVTADAIAITSEMALKTDAEREYMFKHIWRQTKDKFYNANLHGVDWELMYRQYLPKAKAAGNNRDFAIITSELLGELNASHTGTRYRHPTAPAAQTASLGLLFDMVPSEAGLKVAEVLPRSPLLKYADQVKPGSVLTAIDGMPVNAGSNLSKQLNGKQGKRTRLSFINGKSQFDVVVRPQALAAEADAMYKRWVDGRRAYVDNLSGSKLAYVHIPQMDDTAYRAVHSELFGRGFDKQAVVVDTRFNRGGWLTDDLVTLLSGKQYSWLTPRGNRTKGNSMKRWSKPSVLLVNEGNYSDGNCFPNGYRANEIGTIVGMPVPGTCTAVWWEGLQSGDLVFGIPQLGVTNMDGKFMENDQLEPDVLVENDKRAVAKGQDLQLKRAVEVLLGQ